MQEWHFRITGQILIEGDNAEYYIHPENVKSLIRVSDYNNENMPKILLNAALDKNLFDIIATNAKTATFYLQIDKFQKDHENPTNRNYISYIKDEFSIFISDDINYNKEIDYSPVAEEMDGKREDVYKQCAIGLIPKSCIETNKNFANNVFYKTTMMNMLGYYLMNTHLLIEPLKYNKEIAQLAIPPQETLVKTVEFLNNIKVFYDTKYLFFIDEPYCTYLISRSGDGIEKSDDIYLDVCFNIHGKDDNNSMTPGMAEDIKEKRYYIDINVVDTRYTIDHDSAKIYTKIEEIINPDIKNTVSALESVQNIASNIQNVVQNLTNTAQQLTKNFEGLPNSLYNQKMNFNSAIKDWLNEAVPDVNNKVSTFQSLVSSLPDKLTVNYQTSTGSGSGSGGSTTTTASTTLPVYSSSEKSASNSYLSSENGKMNTSYNQVANMNSNFGSLTDTASRLAYDVGRTNNNVGCFTEINVQDGVKSTSRDINQIYDRSGILRNDEQNQIQNNKHYVPETKTAFNNTLSGMSDTISSVEAKISAIESAMSSLPGASCPQLESVKSILDNMKSTFSYVNNNSSDELGIKHIMNSNLDLITSSINDFASIPSNISNIGSQLTSVIPSLTNVLEQNLKGKIKNIFTSLQNIGQTAEKAISKMFETSRLGDALTFGIGDIFKLKENIDAIGDLSGIGKLGIPCFDTKLQIGGCFGGAKEGIKVLRTNNDNSNRVKNIKSEMENKVNQLSINKFDLDPFVFTPNKKYTIMNYNGHSNKNGIFLLNRKTEIYFREDDTFVCNTVLDFYKVADSTSGGDVGSTAAKSTQDPVNLTSQTKADQIANTNSELGKDRGNTSGAMYDTGHKVNANSSNNVLPYIIENARTERNGLTGNAGGTNGILGTMSITDFVSKNNMNR